MEGTVIKSTGKWFDVLDNNYQTWACSIKGKFRVKGLRSTNPVAVGDKVDFEETEDGKGVITTIHDRKNWILRRSVNLSKQIHIIASNIDVCWLVVTLQDPPTSFGFIDRFLVSAQAFNVPVTLVFNKSDLYQTEESIQLLEAYKSCYSLAGYDYLETSTFNKTGIEELKAQMTGKINVFAGHSGVGKSSLANAIQEGLELKTAEVSDFHSKGQHTTTFAEMHPLQMGGFLIDTPGIKGFGIIDIEKHELPNYFPEMFDRLSNCKFHNCRHIQEPGCAVKNAVNEGEIAESRYQSYLNMVDQMDEDQHYRLDIYK